MASDAFTRLRTTDFRGWVLPLLLLVSWEYTTALQWVDTRIIPSPLLVLETAWQWLISGQLVASLISSLWRDIAGFSLGSLIGISVGLALGISKVTNRIAGPTFHTLKHISLFAWIPLLTAFFGREDLAKVVFITFSTLYPVALGTLEGVRGIPLSQLEVARVYGFNSRQTLFRLVLPAASPQILSGLHLGLIYAWLATIGGEFLMPSVGEGIGFTVIRGRASFHIEQIIFGMLIIGGIGYLFNHLATRLETRLLHWRGRPS